MSIFSKLFEKQEDPVEVFFHPILGTMNWSEQSEEWTGCLDGLSFGLAYEGKRVPNEELVSYAVDILSDQPAFMESLRKAKLEAVQTSLRSYEQEVLNLRLGSISFYRYKNQRKIVADLIGGVDSRYWKTEFTEKNCEGIGFDS